MNVQDVFRGIFRESFYMRRPQAAHAHDTELPFVGYSRPSTFKQTADWQPRHIIIYREVLLSKPEA